MIGLLFLIFFLFSVFLTIVWIWFFKNDKSFGENLFKTGIKAFEGGDYKKAKELLTSANGLDSNSEVKYKLGITHLNLGEYDEAKACFEDILKTSPKDFNALFNLAEILLLQKNYDEALAFFTKALNENGNSVECYLNIGKIYYEQGDYAQALEAFEKAKTIAPENVLALFYIAKCKSELCNLENEDECQQILDEYAKIANGRELPPGFHIATAKMYAKKGQINEAYEHCKKALEVDEQDVELYKLLGLIQLIKLDFAAAKSSLSIALSFQSNNMEIHNIFSYVMCHQEKNCSLEKCREKYFELVKKHIK